MWKPIETALDLPAEHTFESNTLDFKAAPTESSLEMGKDVAAFANAQGGTVLVGAHGGDRLERYNPMTVELAQSVAAYDRAVRDRCAPAPLFSMQLIARDEGVVVAVNIQPFPGQVVGVRVLRKDKMERDSGYFFPV